MKINVTADELISIFFIYMIDKLSHPLEIGPNNEKYADIFKKLSVLKGSLTRFYLESDVSERINYKRIRKIFLKDKLSSDYVINILDPNINESMITEEVIRPPNEIKEIVKRTLSALRKRRFYKARLTTDKDIDIIISKVMEKYYKEKK